MFSITSISLSGGWGVREGVGVNVVLVLDVLVDDDEEEEEEEEEVNVEDIKSELEIINIEE